MNPMLRHISDTASATADGTILGVMTLFFLGFFLMWTWWAFRPAHRQAMTEASFLPLHDDNGGER